MESVTYDVNELMQLASAQGLEVCNEIHDTTPKPRYLSREKLLNHRVVYDMPNEEYHSHPTSISSSTVKKATTPIKYAKYLEEGFSVKDNRCLIIGTLFHSLLLEKDKRHEFSIYDEEKLLSEVQAVKPDTLPENLKRTKEWKLLMEQYKIAESGQFKDNVIEKRQFQSIWAVQKRLRKHAEISNLYHNSESEVSFFAQFSDIEVRIRPDLLKMADEKDAEMFADIKVGDAIILSVKTTTDASPNGFARECKKEANAYLLAEAFYHDVLSAILDKNVHVVIMAVEKDKDNEMTGEVMLYQCREHHIASGRRQYENNIEVILHCRKNPVNSLEGYEFHNNNSIIMELQ